MNTHAESSTTLAILAGGLGTRMGTPKGNLRVGNLPILAHLLGQWNWSGPTLLISSPGTEHPPEYERFSAEAVDPEAAAGPVRGLLTALENSSTPTLILSAVDMPCLQRGQFEWLLSTLGQSPELLGIMCQRNGRPEPFPSIFRREARVAIESHIRDGNRSMKSLLEVDRIVAVNPPNWDETVWTNLNTPGDFEAFASLHSHSR